MSSTTLALAASPTRVRSRLAWRVLLAFAGSWLVALLAQVEIRLPFTPVPLTGQTLGVLMVGASLGAGLGGVSMLLYLAQGAIGLPFFSGGESGLQFLRVSAVTGTKPSLRSPRPDKARTPPARGTPIRPRASSESRLPPSISPVAPVSARLVMAMVPASAPGPSATLPPPRTIRTSARSAGS